MNKQINNRGAIIQQLAELLMTSDKEDKHNTIVFLSVDPNTNTVTLETVANDVNGLDTVALDTVANDVNRLDAVVNDVGGDNHCPIGIWRKDKRYRGCQWIACDNSFNTLENELTSILKDILDVTDEDFDAKVLNFHNLNRIDCIIEYYYACGELPNNGNLNYEVKFRDRYEYAMSRDDYKAKLVSNYKKFVDKAKPWYIKQANTIVDGYMNTKEEPYGKMFVFGNWIYCNGIADGCLKLII